MGIRRLIDRLATQRDSSARHLVTDHRLPADAVAAIESGADLRTFHDQDHDNDRAFGLGNDGHGD